MAFELLIFDLDDTLLRTADLQDRFRGMKGLGKVSMTYVLELRLAAAAIKGREVYTQDFLKKIRANYPDLKLAVFTRAPKLYTNTLLSAYYPDIKWDGIVTFEDVKNTKPYPEGIFALASPHGIKHAPRVVLVGDGKVDVVASYRAGIWSVVDTSTWPKPMARDNYYVKERLPDALIDEPEELLSFLASPESFLPLLEMRASKKLAAPKASQMRVTDINHFDRTAEKLPWVNVSILGRRFRNDELLNVRRSWHPVSHEIETHKDADHFPEHWISALRDFIALQMHVRMGMKVAVTVVPAKPGRKPRLEALLQQLKVSHEAEPILKAAKLEFAPQLLAYKAGVKSHSGDHLNAEDRFANVRDHLVVNQAPPCPTVIVIDDVVTTGASLFYASHFLRKAGVAHVLPVSLTKAVSAL